MTTIGGHGTYDTFNIEARRTVIVNQAMTAANPFNVNASDVNFTPQYLIIRQLLYSNVAGTDAGTYLLWSNLQNGGHCAAVYIGIQGVSVMPQTIIPIGMPIQNIQFNLIPANVAFANPTGQLTLVLEFVSLKKGQAISV